MGTDFSDHLAMTFRPGKFGQETKESYLQNYNRSVLDPGSATGNAQFSQRYYDSLSTNSEIQERTAREAEVQQRQALQEQMRLGRTEYQADDKWVRKQVLG